MTLIYCNFLGCAHNVEEYVSESGGEKVYRGLCAREIVEFETLDDGSGPRLRCRSSEIMDSDGIEELLSDLSSG
jgi:hypothetical protein